MHTMTQHAALAADAGLTRRQKQRPDVAEGAIESVGNLDLDVVKQVSGGVVLRVWRDLELWQQEDNHFIETGYRAASDSIQDCFRSWTYIHNETANIYSHVLGGLLFFSTPVYFARYEFPSRYEIATSSDKLVCLIYFVSVAICFCLSATYHTVMCHSQRMDMLGAQLDFQGVILLMWSAALPLVYYGFFCDPILRNTYWALLSTLAVVCSISTFQPRFREPFLRPVRAATFGSLALFTTIPVLHGIYSNGWAEENERMGVVWVLRTLALNAAGATAYAFKIPERWAPRRFDILGASHQIFHVLVVLAALAYTKAILQAFDFVHAGQGFVCRPEDGLASPGPSVL